MVKKTLIALMLLFMSSTAFAAPGGVTSYLMNTPASLFDLGLYKLRKSLDQCATVPTSVSYDWDTDRIEISFYNSKYFTSEEKARDFVKSTTTQIRWCLGVLPDGKPLFDTSLLYGEFSHDGYMDKNSPKDIDETLDSITNIHSKGIYKLSNNTYRLECKTPLLGTDLYCKEPIRIEIQKKTDKKGPVKPPPQPK